MSAYNGEEYVHEAIESVLNQEFVDFELIIIDDGSTDRTKEIILSFADQRIRYYYQQNRGVGAARNRAAKYARGEWLAFIDADDKWTSNKLAVQYSLTSGSDIVFSDCDLLEGNKVLNYSYSSVHRVPDLQLPVLKPLIADNFIPLSSVAIMKQCFLSVDGFSTKLKYGEDYDLYLRLALKMSKFRWSSQKLLTYRINPAGASAKNNHAKYLSQIYARVARKTGDSEIKILAISKSIDMLKHYYGEAASFGDKLDALFAIVTSPFGAHIFSRRLLKGLIRQ